MKDLYANFDELKKAENPKSYRIRSYPRAATAVIAIHGGGIEPGTSELAKAIAGADHSFYAFEGRKPKPEHNRDLHITSTRFREPKCFALVTASENVVAIHGQSGDTDVVRLGGRDEVMKRRLCISLRRSGFPVEIIPKGEQHEGRDEDNICNLGKRRAGVQMELLEGMRSKFFRSLQTRRGRQNPRRQPFWHFVAAVRASLCSIQKQSSVPGKIAEPS